MKNRQPLNILPGMEAFAEGLTINKVKHPANGYAATPGTGPKDQTCKTCQHVHRSTWNGRKTFIKCALMQHAWTNSYGTDIRASSPACRRWEAIAP
jgi:hypothetical protein